MTIYFVKTRHHYAPYDDWYKLAALSGFDTCMEDELDVDNPDHTYILNHFGACGRNGKEIAGRAQVILWQTEYIKPEQYALEYGTNITRYWHMDAWQAEALAHEYIPIGSHRDLGYVGINGAYKYDIALMAYASGRRAETFLRMASQFTVTPNCWGDKRTRALRTSRLMVHIHQQDNMAAIPGIRMALAAAYGLPVLIESVNNLGIYQGCVTMVRLENIMATAAVMVDDNSEARNELSRTASLLNHLLCDDFTFKKVVEGNV